VKISIVMAYANRKEQLLRTLNSISQTKHKDYEIIIVDDNSDKEHSLENFKYDKVIIKCLKERNWENPCIPYNIGFELATGDVIIIQNPECIHYGDVLEHVEYNIKDDNYISYSCFAINKKTTESLSEKISRNEFSKLEELIKENSLAVDATDVNGWYNHKTIRNTAFHFCSAITAKNLKLLGGFDERYSTGCNYDDNEFLQRIKRLQLKIEVVEDLKQFVIHQYHNSKRKEINNFIILTLKNKQLFEQVTQKETTYIAPMNNYFKSTSSVISTSTKHIIKEEYWNNMHKEQNIQWLTKSSPDTVYDFHHIRDIIESNQQKNIMEIGIGFGDSIRYISRKHSITAVDITAEAFKSVEKVARCVLTPEITRLFNKQFDLILSHLVFQHCDDETIKFLLRESFRLLKKDGFFTYQFSVLPDNAKIDDNFKKTIDEGLHYFRTKEEMINLTAESGGQIIKIYGPKIYPEEFGIEWYIFRCKAI